jgi:hypothetical protein
MKFTDKRMVYQTAEAFLELNHPDGSKSEVRLLRSFRQ